MELGSEQEPVSAANPLLDLTPRKLPSSAVPPQPRGQHCPGDLSQPLGLRATTHYPVTAGLRRCERGCRRLAGRFLSTETALWGCDHSGARLEAACPQGGHSPGAQARRCPIAQHSLDCAGSSRCLHPWGAGPVVQPLGQDRGGWATTLAWALPSAATVPCRSRAAPALSPGHHTAGLQELLFTESECTGFKRTPQDHPS